MSTVEFTRDEKELIVQKIQNYFEEELNSEIGQFDAEFLLDFIAKELGNYFYNRGLFDAQAILEKKLENITEAIYELEKVTDLRR